MPRQTFLPHASLTGVRAASKQRRRKAASNHPGLQEECAVLHLPKWRRIQSFTSSCRLRTARCNRRLPRQFNMANHICPTTLWHLKLVLTLQALTTTTRYFTRTCDYRIQIPMRFNLQIPLIEAMPTDPSKSKAPTAHIPLINIVITLVGSLAS